jgi:hypothetical protein
VDLTGTSIGGELRLGSSLHESTKWKPNAIVILTNTDVGALQDTQHAWPDRVMLDGFTYSHLGGLGSEKSGSQVNQNSGNKKDEASKNMIDRDSKWYIAWLDSQGQFSYSPYQELANRFTKLGYQDRAQDILFAARERERKGSGGFYWVWLTLMKVFIGYGHRLYYSLFWIFGLVHLGALVFRSTHEARLHRMPYGIAYSFDMLLPVIKLREKHYSIDLKGPARYYFYVHKLMGYILASFLAAGLSGLTK